MDPLPDERTVRLSGLQPGPDGARAVVLRIREHVQTDPRLMFTLRRTGVHPGAVVIVKSSPGRVVIDNGGEAAELSTQTAAHVFVPKR